jgi:hypothetical protein
LRGGAFDVLHVNPELVVRKPATYPRFSKCDSPKMDGCAEARKKADELMKKTAAAIETAEQAAETSRDLLLESKSLRKVLERTRRNRRSKRRLAS